MKPKSETMAQRDEFQAVGTLLNLMSHYIRRRQTEIPLWIDIFSNKTFKWFVTECSVECIRIWLEDFWSWTKLPGLSRMCTKIWCMCTYKSGRFGQRTRTDTPPVCMHTKIDTCLVYRQTCQVYLSLKIWLEVQLEYFKNILIHKLKIEEKKMKMHCFVPAPDMFAW